MRTEKEKERRGIQQEKEGQKKREREKKGFSLFAVNLIIIENGISLFIIYLFIDQHFNCQIIHTVDARYLEP